MAVVKPRVLTVCVGGMVRSVAVKDALNGHYGCNAIAISAVWQDAETQHMMAKWADLIVPVQTKELLGADADGWVYETCKNAAIWHMEYESKRMIFNVGLDEWGNPRDKRLIDWIHMNIGPVRRRIKDMNL